MKAIDFFTKPQATAHRQYEALRAFYVEDQSAAEVAEEFGYTVSSFYSLNRDFKQRLETSEATEQFFANPLKGRKPKDITSAVEDLIIQLRQQSLSVPDIKATLDAQSYCVSESTIYTVIKQAGFGRLPRRSRTQSRAALSSIELSAPTSKLLTYVNETFSTQHSIGVLGLVPYFQQYGIDQVIVNSDYPETQSVNRLSSILSFVALKLSNIRRYGADDLWCMDRGLGLFAGLNVLPKTAWFSAYSYRVSREMNHAFLKALSGIWQQHELLSESANLDFTTLPHWGDATHLENNWSGTRNKSLTSLLAVLAQDPDSGLITYGDTTLRHQTKNNVVLEFVDFYHTHHNHTLNYLIFDSKFTTYEQLKQLDELPNPIKFITIRRRGKRIVDELNALPKSAWKTTRVKAADGRNRTLQVHEQTVFLQGYGKDIRQLAIAGTGRIKPALLITNDFDLSIDQVIRKYARRWLVEQEIDEHIQFFHLNRLSSSMVIKVDFDLTMSILAHNLYRLLASDLQGYTHLNATSLFEKFICNSGHICIAEDTISISMKKKRHLPILLSALEPFQNQPVAWMGNRKLRFAADTSS
ncbi:MAG: transposase [Cyanobacteria bacterium P01_C01_bin.118]